MTLQLLHSEFPYILGKFDFLFYQCRILARPACAPIPIPREVEIFSLIVVSYVLGERAA
jgi:hypothetical protein